MIIATTILVLGLLIGAWTATTHGYRLGGVVVVSLWALYTLIDFTILPILLFSTIAAYAGIWLIQEHWLVYGRRLLLTGILIGMIIPIGTLLLIDLIAGTPFQLIDVQFLGSILPGIAAYNFYRQDHARRLRDAVAGLALLITLIALGVLMLVVWTSPPCLTCRVLPDTFGSSISLLLLGYGSDIASTLGYPTTPPSTTVGSLTTVTVVVLIGLALAEFIRSRLGFRPVGVIAIPLVALFALRAWWILPLYLLIGALTTLAVLELHRATLLYGRALLSISTAIGVTLALVAYITVGLPDALITFFAGLLAGIGAYNIHVAAPRERHEVLIVSAGIFVIVSAVARLLITPLPTGIGTPLTLLHTGLAIIILAWALGIGYRIERDRPSRTAITAASIFNEETTR